jgi:hypothetical protein
MTVRIDDFKAAFNKSGGFARANRYEVDLPNSATLGLPDEREAEKLTVICDSVTWPGRQIFTEEVFTTMNSQKVAYSFGQEDVDISFILGNDWYAWDYLYEWQERVVGNIGGVRGFFINYMEDYARNNVIIRHLDTENKVRKAVKLKNAYPTTVNSIELGNSNENEVIRVSATFAYDNWEITNN